MSTTEIWRQYEQGVDYKTRIGLYRTVDLNERFYAGEQWVGVPHEGLPTPVVNFIKYASAWKIAAVAERRLKMQFFAEGRNDGGDIGIYAKQISGYCDMLWERLRMDYITKEGLKQAAITGDYVQYFYWDSALDTGQAVTGDIATQLIDNVSYYPGNPNMPDVQGQPYIILAFREMVDKVREEARSNGCDARDIVPDEETEYTAGDRGKVEMDGGGKCNVLLRMTRKDGRIWCEKATRNAVVQPPKDSKLTRYPVALMNWDTRKNCCHGVAEVTGLIPNQVYVNKIMALSQLSQMQMSFPKVVYDRTRIREWTNRVAGAIPVNGDIGGAAQYLSPPGVAYDAWRGLDVTLDKTMRMMGANDVTLGSIRNPDNTSAFIAARDAAMVPLQSHQERFYAFIEDVGLIWLDFIRSFYKGGRMIPLVQDGQRIFIPLPDDALDEYAMRLRVEVGPSTMWSEIQVLQTLDNLLKGGKLSLKQYLERLPDGHIPLKQELLEETAALEAGQQGAGGGVTAAAAGPVGPGGGMPPGVGSAATMEAVQQGKSGGMPQAGMMGGQPAGGSPAGQAPSGAAGAQSGGELAALLKLVQAGVQNGDVKPEAAQAVGRMVQGGAGAAEIVSALEQAAAQGLVSERLMAALAQGGMDEQTGRASSGTARHPSPEEDSPREGAAGVQDGGELAALLKLVQAGAQNGDVKPEAAQAIGRMVQGGAGSAEIVAALEQAAAQGLVSERLMAALAQAGAADGERPPGIGRSRAGQSPPGAAHRPSPKKGSLGGGAGRRSTLTGTNNTRKAENAMNMGDMRGSAAAGQPVQAPVEALLVMLKEGVASGDVDADVPEIIGRLAEQEAAKTGAGGRFDGGAAGDLSAALLAALKQAMEAGKISPLMMAKAEKLLSAGAPAAADEPTDRTQILRGNRNQLMR